MNSRIGHAVFLALVLAGCDYQEPPTIRVCEKWASRQVTTVRVCPKVGIMDMCGGIAIGPLTMRTETYCDAYGEAPNPRYRPK